MKVETLMDKLRGLDREASVEFWDLTHERRCPVNSVDVLMGVGVGGARGAETVVLTNHPEGMRKARRMK